MREAKGKGEEGRWKKERKERNKGRRKQHKTEGLAQQQCHRIKKKTKKKEQNQNEMIAGTISKLENISQNDIVK